MASRMHKSKRSQKKTYRNFKRKSFKNKINKNLSNVVLGQGFPKKIVVHHKYRENLTLSSTTGIFNRQEFSCNSLYDPNASSTGHQPMYFDQVAALYDQYCVIASKITWKVIPKIPGSVPYRLCVFINDDNVLAVSDIDTIAEYPTGQIKIVSPDSNRPVTFTQKWSARKTFGKNIIANSRFVGTVTTNPVEQSFYALGLQGITGTSDNVDVYVEALIEYIAVWDELRDIAGS